MNPFIYEMLVSDLKSIKADLQELKSLVISISETRTKVLSTLKPNKPKVDVK